MPGSEFTVDALGLQPATLPWGEVPPASEVQPDADLLAVTEQFAAIESLIESGHTQEAREACAHLIYAFQPAIVADPWLLGKILNLLERSAAHGLRRLLARATGMDEGSRPRL